MPEDVQPPAPEAAPAPAPAPAPQENPAPAPAAAAASAPAAAGEAPAAPPRPPSASAGANVAKILVADDVSLMRSLLVRALVKSGYVVLEARHGKQALEIAGREKPDLIILDSMMPVMSGPECLKKLKSTDGLKDIPVIMCTAKSEKGNVLEAAQAGACDYIVKPFRIETILERISKRLPPGKRGSSSASAPLPA